MRGPHNAPQWVPAAKQGCPLGGILWASAHTLPCQRTGATCRDAGPPTPTAAGWGVVAAAQVAASAAAAGRGAPDGPVPEPSAAALKRCLAPR